MSTTRFPTSISLLRATLVGGLFSLGLSASAVADCICNCVNGRVQPICSRVNEIPPICSPQICPIQPPSIQPISPPTIPPIGTQRCGMKQVLNPFTGQYEWKQICE